MKSNRCHITNPFLRRFSYDLSYDLRYDFIVPQIVPQIWCQPKTISGPKNVSYDKQLCPIIVKSPSAPSAQATHQITNRHYEEVKSSCPDSQTIAIMLSYELINTNKL
jgi:hypothetical protein